MSLIVYGCVWDNSRCVCRRWVRRCRQALCRGIHQKSVCSRKMNQVCVDFELSDFTSRIFIAQLNFAIYFQVAWIISVRVDCFQNVHTWPQRFNIVSRVSVTVVARLGHEPGLSLDLETLKKYCNPRKPKEKIWQTTSAWLLAVCLTI